MILNHAFVNGAGLECIAGMTNSIILNKMDSLGGLAKAWASEAVNTYKGTEAVEMFHSDGTEAVFKIDLGKSAPYYLTDRGKPSFPFTESIVEPRCPFTAGIMDGIPVAIAGRALTKTVCACRLEKNGGKELWKLDTKVNPLFKGDKLGIFHVIIGKLRGQDVAIMGSHSGMFSIVNKDGKALFDKDLKSDVEYVSYINYKGKDIYAAALYDGSVVLFNEGANSIT
jgi:hypothetical protein